MTCIDDYSILKLGYQALKYYAFINEQLINKEILANKDADPLQSPL